MFRGHHYRSLDDRSRLMIPPDFRRVIHAYDKEGRVVLTNLDGCIVGYPLKEWEEIEESFYSALNIFNSALRDFHRFFISRAVEVSLDKQGRILIPSHLKSYAFLKKEVVLAGVGKRFEIWDKERYEEKFRKLGENLDAIGEELLKQGIELKL